MGLWAGLRERRELGAVCDELAAARRRVAALEGAAVSLVGCVRALVLEVDELGALELKAGLSALATELRAGADAVAVADLVRAQHGAVVAFAERERAYLAQRDAELRRIIQLLTDGLAGVGDGAAAYHQRLLANGNRLEAASRLSDLVKMRAAIATEVSGLRAAVAERQAEEAAQASSLRREIAVLREHVAKARSEARTDALTGAANRAAFDEELARRCALAGQGLGGFALLLSDLDHFKKINDTYGHPIGDRVLTAYVEFLRARVRESDLVARCGGEEFALILPGAALRPALRKARRLVEELARCEWAVDPTTKLRFTASVGVTAWEAGDEPARVVERADRALYRAKQDGRNRASRAA